MTDTAQSTPTTHTDVGDLHARAVMVFADLVTQVPDDRWSAPTPDSGWDVRALVNHVAGEELWTVPLVDGAQIADVGNRFDGDVLGDDPVAVVRRAAAGAVAAFGHEGALQRTVHLSFGDTPGDFYCWGLTADHVVHAWDLAVAIGVEWTPDHELVDGVAAWFATVEQEYRAAGAVGPRAGVVARTPADELLVAFGRDPGWTAVHDVVRRLGAAWESWDLDAMLALMAPDGVFEATGPAPDGTRAEGHDAIRAMWEPMISGTRDPSFTVEESFVCGDRATARWRFGWMNDDGSEGHIRGVDVLKIRDGLVAEKLSYVKG